jgi:hypothetical protein
VTQFAIEANIRDLSGDLIMALEDEANGYWVRAGGLLGQQRRWTSNESTSPWVDGSSLVSATIDANEGSLLVKVFGPNWVSVETRYQALLAATSSTAWLYEESIQGVSKLWRAGPVSVIEAPPEPVDIANNRRFVVLTFTVQPTPVITGLEP